MMVPMCDFQNHLPIDTSFDVYPYPKKSEKTNHTDFSIIYSKEFLEDLDPEEELKIKGVP
jgi:hypothetical protein